MFLALFIKLGQHTTNASVTGIGVHYETLCEVWKGQDWGSAQLVAQFSKSGLAFDSPFKGCGLLSQFVQRLCYTCKVADKPAIVTCQTEEFLYILD